MGGPLFQPTQIWIDSCLATTDGVVFVSKMMWPMRTEFSYGTSAPGNQNENGFSQTGNPGSRRGLKKETTFFMLRSSLPPRTCHSRLEEELKCSDAQRLIQTSPKSCIWWPQFDGASALWYSQIEKNYWYENSTTVAIPDHIQIKWVNSPRLVCKHQWKRSVVHTYIN